MADQIFNAASSGSSPFSILNVLPTKRIDAAIAAAAQSGTPEQGKQTGGYVSAYTHFSHLPLLPLYSQAQNDLQAKQQSHKEMLVKDMDASDPDKLLSGGQRAVLNIMSLLSSGAGIISAKRWERRLVGTNVISVNKMMEQNQGVVFTRWTVPTVTGIPWFVDVLEQQLFESFTKTSRIHVTLKAGLPLSNAKKDNKVTLKLLNMETKGLKSQKSWTKNRNLGSCEALTFVDDDGKEVPMEIVARIQRACSLMEAHEVEKRFRKHWVVPILQYQA